MVGVPRYYVALLRGIAPANPLMRNVELRTVFEGLGYGNVRTVLSSGNVLFETPERSSAALEAAIERAMHRHLGRPCTTLVRSRQRMEQVAADDVFDALGDLAGRQPIVTFVKAPPARLPNLPSEQDGGSVLALQDGALFSVVDAAGSAPVLRWIESEFGTASTTRSWRTVQRIVAALAQEP